MPYDPRPVAEGGNRGIDTKFSRYAPPGMFRVVWVDTFDGSDGIQGDYDTFEKAREMAHKEGGEMSKAYVYDDQGRCRHEEGTF